jgi:Glycosyl hydrolases family 16
MTVQYIVEQSSASTGPWTTVPGSPFTTLTDTVTGLTPNTNYFFRITANDTVFGVMGPQTVVGPVKTSTSLTESPQGTRLTSTTGQIVDSSLQVWSIVATATSPGALAAPTIGPTSVGLTWTAPTEQQQVKHPDGSTDGSSVDTLLYWNHLVYRHDTAGWAHWNGTGWTSDTGDPSNPITESAQGTTVTDPTGVITDALGGTWRLAGTLGTGTYATPGSGSILFNGQTWTIDTGGNILANGVQIPDGGNSSAIDLFNGVMYGQDASTLQWFAWNPSTQTFSAAAAPGNIPSGNALQVVHNGNTDGSTNHVILLLYWNHQVYYENNTSAFFVWNGSNWTPTSDPRGSQLTESPNDTLINSTTGQIVDANLTVWKLVLSTSSGLQVQRGPTVDTTTASVLLLLYHNHVVYQESSFTNSLGVNPGWWFWDGNKWVDTNGDPRGQVVTLSTTASGKSPSIALSNGNLTAQSSGAVSQSVLSTLGYTTGKFYFEVTLNAITSDTGIGIANGSYNLADPLQLGGQLNASVGYYPITPPQAIYNGSGTGGLDGFGRQSQGTASDAVGAILNIAVDFTAKLIWTSSPAMRTQSGNLWNNSSTANPATGAGGVSFSNLSAGPYFAAFNDDMGGAQVTFNFGATTFARTVPTGFSAWGSGGQTSQTNSPTFTDDFSTLSLYNTRNTAAGGKWQPSYWYANGSDPSGDGLILTNGSGWQVNPFNPATPLNTIYTVNNSILNIQLAQTPTQFSSACQGAPFITGTIQTAPTFRQLYGYFEARIAVPKIQGWGIAFFMMTDQSWPPEIDVAEMWSPAGQNNQWFSKVSVWDVATASLPDQNTFYSNQAGSPLPQPFDTSAFHTYAVDWQQNTMTFYYDRIQCLQIPTPAGYNVPLFPIITSTPGTASNIQGPITNPSLLPVNLQVDYCTVWKTRPF